MNCSATVVSCDAGVVRLNASGSSNCVACANGGGCRSLAFLSPSKSSVVELPNDRQVKSLKLQPGMAVQLQLDPGAFRKAAYWAYGLPALMLVVASVLASVLGASDTGVALAAATGLVSALVLGRLFAGGLDIDIISSANGE